ncbi:ABC transporter permease [Acidobacteriota bacterium]
MSDRSQIQKPPRLTEWFIKFLSWSDDKDVILENLREEYEDRVSAQGRFSARLWYRLHALKSVLPFISFELIWRISMFKNYLKIAFRNIKKYKVYSFINILGLAVGMACCILILLWVQDEVSYDRFHENGDNLYRITVDLNGNVWRSSPWALFAALKRDYPEIEMGTWYYETTVNSRYQQHNYNEDIVLVAPEFFKMFTYPIVQGDAETPLSDLNSVVISEKTAAKYFGTADPVGKIIQFENSVDLMVTGVMEDVPANSHMEFDLVARPEVFLPKERILMWRMDCPSYLLLSEGTNYQEVVGKIADSINRYDQQPTKYIVGLQPLRKIHLYALNGTDPIVYIYIFFSIAVLILLIACINFMNLSTARSSHRAKEIGMRKVIGASRGDVIKQFFSESVLLSLMALVFAVVAVHLCLPAFNIFAEKQLTLDLFGNAKIGIGLMLITLLTGLISGSYPSFYLSSFQPVAILRKTIRKGGKSKILRRALIIFQFTVAVGLIISTLIILKQMRFIYSKDLGFDRSNVLTLNLSENLRGKYVSLKEDLLKNAEVENVSAANSLPMRIRNNNTVYWEGKSREQAEMIHFVCVDYDYFETMQMEIVSGRSFSRDFPTDTNNYIINETALRMTGYENPIGKMYAVIKSRDNPENDIGVLVGVVKDFHGTPLHDEIHPTVFMLYDMLPKFRIFIRINSSDIAGTIDHIKETFSAFSPDYIFEYRFLDEQFDQMYRTEHNLQALLKTFTIFAIFVSCLGLFGLASFMAEQRTKEVAIRKVLGAKTVDVMAKLSKEFVVLVLLANILAWPGAFYFMNSWLQGFAYHTKIEWFIFIFAGIMAVLIALLTVSFVAYRAASSSPAKALKHE